MFNSYRFEIGSSYRQDFMIRLDELGLPYTEHRNWIKSTIVVKTYNDEQAEAFYEFSIEFRDWEKRLKAHQRKIEQARHQERLEEIRKENAKKLARKNRFRKLTFRKPLHTL
jgi:hypothetical protein